MGLFDYFSGQDAQNAAGAQTAGIQQGYGDLSKFFDQGRQSLTSSLAPFQQNLQTSQAGQGAYADATGANGAAGNTRATNNFQAGPGYAFNMQQMMDNLSRVQQANGQGNSGATDVAALTQAHGLADQGWQSYIQNLAPFLGSSNAAATGVAGVNSNINQSFQGQGNAAYGADTSQGNAQANADLASYTASGNLWNTLLGGANAAAKAYGAKG